MFWRKTKKNSNDEIETEYGTAHSYKVLKRHQGSKKIEKDYARAKAAWDKGDFQTAVNLYENILEECPTHISSLEDLGLLAIEVQNLPAAEHYFIKALEIEPEYTRLHGHLGKFYLINEQNDKKAQDYFEKGLAINPEDSSILDGLAILHHLKGDNATAARYFKQAYESHKHISHLLNWIRMVHKFKDKNDFVYRELKTFESNIKDVARADLPFLYNALGKAEESFKNYEKAFEYYKLSADATRDKIKYNEKAQSQFFEYQKQYFSREFAKNNNLTGSDSDAPVFLIGMPRSGSTLLDSMLDSHPDIYSVGESDFLTTSIAQHLYMPDQDSGIIYPLKRPDLSPDHDVKWLADEYLAFLSSHNSSAKRYIDKELSHFRWVGVLATAFPNAKFIHCRRHALDTCLSCFTHLFNNDSQEFSYNLEELGNYYRLYDDLMTHWHNVYPERILDVHYEDVIHDAEQELRKTLDFIDMPFDPACLEFHHNDRVVYTASAGQVHQTLYNSAIGKWKRYEAYISPLVKAMGDSAPEDARYLIKNLI